MSVFKRVAVTAAVLQITLLGGTLASTIYLPPTDMIYVPGIGTVPAYPNPNPAAEPADQGQLFSDAQAAQHVNKLAIRGIRLLLRWRKTFHAQVAAITAKLDSVQNRLDTDYAADNLPNMTDYALTQLAPVRARLDSAQGIVDSLNISSDGDGLVAFMRSPIGTVNVPEAFAPGNRAGGTFTAPQRGLYQITVRTKAGSSKTVYVQRNGNETLSTCEHSSSYYDLRTRITLKWLNAGDEIFTTGNTVPATFGVVLLQSRPLMPSTI